MVEKVDTVQSLKYNKSEVVPVTVNDGLYTDVANTKLTLPSAVSPFVGNMASLNFLANYLLGPNTIENTTDSSLGNFVYVGYGRGSGGIDIKLNSATEATLLKMVFRKVTPAAALSENAFSYFSNGGVVKYTCKFAYLSTEIIQAPVKSGTYILFRPDLFKLEKGNALRLACSTVADKMDTGDPSIDSYFNDAIVTKVTLKTSYNSPVILESASIDPLFKSIMIPGLANGNYVLSISRNGFLVRDIAVTISNAAVDLGNKPLIPGDLVVDGAIDVSDLGVLLSAFGASYGDVNYAPVPDFNVDGSIDVADLGVMLANFGSDISIYGESVDFNA